VLTRAITEKMKSTKTLGSLLVLALSAWLGKELYESHLVNEKLEASRRDVERSSDLLRTIQEKHLRLAKNAAQAGAPQNATPASEQH
jgi:hypothetical protein